MPSKHIYDVSIVGAGLVGSSTALQLSRLGYSVAVLDSNRSGGAGTTSYSSGIIRCWYTSLNPVKLSLEGMHHYKNWKQFLNCPEIEHYASDTMRRYPGLKIRDHISDTAVTKSAGLMRSIGIEVQDLDVGQITRMVGRLRWQTDRHFSPNSLDDPSFGEDNGEKWKGGYLVPETYYVSDPKLAVENLKTAAEYNGAKYHLAQRVTDILKEDGAIAGVKTESGETFNSKIVVNAAGPWSSLINKLAFTGHENDMKFQTRPLRQEVAYVPAPPGVDFDKHGVISADFECGVYLRPEHGNRILLGSVEPECDTLEFIEPEDFAAGNYATDLGDAWQKHVYRFALRVPELPIPTGKQVQGIYSFYDVTPDWTPIYDKSSIPGYYMGIGTSGNQFKNAGPLGKLLAGVIDNCENGTDHDRDPFQLEMEYSRPGDFIDSGAYSRLREPSGGANVMG